MGVNFPCRPPNPRSKVTPDIRKRLMGSTFCLWPWFAIASTILNPMAILVLPQVDKVPPSYEHMHFSLYTKKGLLRPFLPVLSFDKAPCA